MRNKMTLDPHPIDIHVGKKLRAIRIMRNMVQEELGKAVGITTQQIQKYEKGYNRISASRLYDLACALNINVSYFFAGYAANAPNNQSTDILCDVNSTNLLSINNKDAIKMLNSFCAIKDPEVQKRISALISVLATAEQIAGKRLKAT